ncbi:hypothetical protein D3C80_1761530 [compost metagenome]
MPGIHHGLRHFLGLLQASNLAQLINAVFQASGVLCQGPDHLRAFAAESLYQFVVGSGVAQVAKLAFQLGQNVQHRQDFAVVVGELHPQFFRGVADVFKEGLVAAAGVAAFHGAAQGTDHRHLFG